jgi:hypothetical protein
MTNPSFKFTREVSTAYLEMQGKIGEDEAIIKLIATTCEIIKTYSPNGQMETLIQMFRLNLVNTRD